MKALAASGEKGLLELMAATHTGMTVEEFTKVVQDWAATARHPEDGTLAHRDGLSTDARGA